MTEAKRSMVIREVGQGEAWYLFGDRARRFSRTVRMTTSLDLFSRLDVLNKAIRLWMSAQPLLRANIVDIEGKKCFVYDERFGKHPEWTEDSSDLDNVKYLVLHSEDKLAGLGNKEAFFDDVSMLMCAKEVDVNTDISTQLLWSLVFLELSGTDDSARQYAMIFVVNHSISEGKNAPMILLQLLDLIEHQWSLSETEKKNFQTVKEIQVQPDSNELYYKNFDQSKCSYERMASMPFVRKARYIEPIEGNRCPSRPYQWAKILADARIFRSESASNRSTVRKEFIRLDELINENELIMSKYRGFTLSQEDTSKFLERCKKEKCTVNIALVNLLAYSLRKLHESIDASELGQINVGIPITLRQFKPTLPGYEPSAEFTSHLTMGCYVANSALPLPKLMALASSQLDDVDEFWNCCRFDQAEFRKVIDSEEYMLPLKMPEMKPSEGLAIFAVSNYGALPGKLPDKFALSAQSKFNVTHVYSDNSMHNPNFWFVGPLVFLVGTYNGRMSLSFSYNSFLLSHARVDQLTESFFDLFKRFVHPSFEKSNFN